MIDRIYEYMTRHNMTQPGSTVLAAVSGGADSMCLLEVLRDLRGRLGIDLRVLHVHHGLRESAEGDLLYVEEYCGKAGIPFEAVRVDAAVHAAQSGLSIEEAARHLRYEALGRAAQTLDRSEAEGAAQSEIAGEDRNEAASADRNEAVSADRSEAGNAARICRIAVAHHREDQAETVLFNLVRGSRLTGLRGMLPVNGRIIRPLMECSRREIEEFLTERGISWREDETNEDVRYSRNLIRREVMPMLEQINSGAQEHIARAAEEAAEAEEFLRAETQRALRACRLPQSSQGAGILSIRALMEHPPLIQRRAVYETAAAAAGGKKDLQDVHIRAVLRLAGRQGNGRVDLPAGVQVEKEYGKLIFHPARAAGSRASGSAWQGANIPPAESTPRQWAPGSARQGANIPPAESAPRQRESDWPLEAGEYSCRVLCFDGDMAAVPRKQYTKWLDYDKIGAFPELRTRRAGDRITLDESGKTKTIARYMIDSKVPGPLRDRIVLPAKGSEILWIPDGRKRSDDEDVKFAGRPAEGGRISAGFKVKESTKRVLEIRWEPKKQ